MKSTLLLCMFISHYLSAHFIPPVWQHSSTTWTNTHQYPEKEVVIIVPSYKNALWYQANLDSIFAQQYTHYRVIYIDDCSPDNTAYLVEQYVRAHHQEHRFTLIKNTLRQGALANLYHAIHSCPDHVIIVTLDGDDWFACNNVLQIINEAYQNQNIWLTYGQFIIFPHNRVGFCKPMTDEIIAHNAYRTAGGYSHLRTFYARLFKQIKKDDLLQLDGNFYAMSWDVAMMVPMFEMANGKFMFIPHILYVYNFATNLNDYKVDARLQWNLDVEIRQKPPYQPLTQFW